MKTYLVTGGAGFIGSYVIQELLKDKDAFIYNVDRMSTGSDVKNLIYDHPRVENIFADICHRLYNYRLYKKIDFIIHLAAESHVDRSIESPQNFIDSNVTGTLNILETCKENKARMVHVSTDEVYGHLLDGEAPFTEEHPLKPRSPYSASKAASDLLVQSYITTFNINASITRCCNNYGARQHKEKLIPYVLNSIKREAPIGVYGDGTNMREWIHASDHAKAVIEVLHDGTTGEVYNIPGTEIISNIDLITRIINYTVEKYPKYKTPKIKFVKDRLGHDFKYELTTKHKLKAVSNQRPFCIESLVDRQLQ